jgi:chromosome segregation ATPase
MALHDPDPLLALIASFLTLVGNFFAILFGTYDTDAFWTKRCLSGNTEDYYWHIFCWSLDEYGRARAFCWIFVLVAVVVLYFTVGSCRGSGRRAVERRALESELETCRKDKVQGNAEIERLKNGGKDADTEIKRLKNEVEGLVEQVSTTAKTYSTTISGLKEDLSNIERAKSLLKSDFEKSTNAAKAAEEKVTSTQNELEAERKTTAALNTEVGKLKDQAKVARGKVEELTVELQTTKAGATQVGKHKKEAEDANGRRNHVEKKLIEAGEEQERLKTEAKNARAALQTAETETKKVREASRKTSGDARRLERELKDEKERSQGLEKDLGDEKSAIEAAQKQHENDYAGQAAKYESKITKQQTDAENQAKELQEEHESLVTSLRAALDAAKQQKQTDHDDLGKVTTEMTKLKEHTGKAAENAAQEKVQLERENQRLRTELEETKGAAEQTKKLQQSRETGRQRLGETLHAMVAQRSLRNNNDMRAQTSLANDEAATAIQTELAKVQNRAEKAEEAAKDAAKHSDAMSQELSTMRTDRAKEQTRLRSAEHQVEQLTTSLQEAEDQRTLAERSLMAATDRLNEAAAPRTTYNVCGYYLNGTCRDGDDCHQDHPEICEDEQCTKENVNCAKYHRKKPKVCAS